MDDLIDYFLIHSLFEIEYLKSKMILYCMKTTQMIQDSVAKPIHKLAVHGNYKLIGSNAKRGLLYSSDYDIYDKVHSQPDILADYFSKLDFSKMYFMDFKAGKDPHQPDGKLRWTPEEMKQKWKYLNDGKTEISLQDALQQDMTIKLDVVIPIGNTFAEVSENYDYRQTRKSKKETLKSLEEDIEQYSTDNTMKALKRFYSVLTFEKTHKKEQKELEAFFNSEYGLLNKVANDLDLLLLLTNTHKIDFRKVKSNTEMLKEKLGHSSLAPNALVLEFNKIRKGNYKTIIKQIVSKLRGIINPVAKDLLKKLYF